MFHYCYLCCIFVKYQSRKNKPKNKVIHFQYVENKGFEEWLLKTWHQIQEGRFNKKCDNDTCPYCRARLDLV
jgi:hypothetical protein